MLQLLLLTRTFEASDPLDICGALGWWALFAFCSHVFFARTLDYPYGALLEYSLIPIFLIAFKWRASPLYKPDAGAMCNDTRKPPGGHGSAEPMLSTEEDYLGSAEDGTGSGRDNKQYGTFSFSSLSSRLMGRGTNEQGRSSGSSDQIGSDLFRRIWLYEADGGQE